MRIALLPLILAACSPSTDASTPSPATESVPRAIAPASVQGLTPDTVVATWAGGQLSAADLQARVGQELRNRQVQFLLDQYELQASALDVLVMESLLQDEVTRRGMADINELLRAEVEARVPEPTDAEVAEFYPVVERQLRGATLEEARPIIVSELLRRGQEERYRAYIDELRAVAGLTVNLPYPDLPRADVTVEPHDPTRGPDTAQVTIVQFAEYQCYFCNQVNPTLDRILDEYPDKVRLVWKDFPLSNHGRALPAAIAAHCAGEQERYWDMNRVLMRNQHALSDADIAGYASDLGIAPEPFQKCMSSNRHEPLVRQDLETGEALGVQATPTFFINGVLLSGAQPYERFKAVVERELGG